MPQGQPTAEAVFAVREVGGSRGTATLRLRHSLDADCGGHQLRLGCALWVYNQTGLPIALQQVAGRGDKAVRSAVTSQLSVSSVRPTVTLIVTGVVWDLQL